MDNNSTPVIYGTCKKADDTFLPGSIQAEFFTEEVLQDPVAPGHVWTDPVAASFFSTRAEVCNGDRLFF